MTTTVLVVLAVAALIGYQVYIRKTEAGKIAEVSRLLEGDGPIRVPGVSWFRKPYEYGVLDETGNYGELVVTPERLVVKARTRKTHKVVAPPRDSLEGGSIRIIETREGGRNTYQVEIPKRSIRRIYRPLLNFGISYNVEYLSGNNDQLEAALDGRWLAPAALRHHGYPI